MPRIWLLFGLLVLGRGQIIYPDQYELMRTSTLPPYPYTGDGRASISNSQPVRYDLQYNPESVQQAAAGAPGRTLYSTIIPATYYPTATPVPQYYASVAPAASTAYYPSAPSAASATYYPSAPASSPQPLPQSWSNHVNDIIAKGIMKFSLDLNRAIYNARDASPTSHRDNAIFSPLSIGVALSLVLAGSAGRTFDEVSRVLGLEAGIDISRHSEVFHQMFGLMLAIVNYKVEGSNGPRVDSASGIFVQEGYPIRPEFRAISENVYQSDVINLNFQRRGKEAQDIINNWVKERTMGKITSILSNEPSPVTNVILLSALYFKGEWNQHFLEGITKRREFFIEPNEAIEVDMMYNNGDFPFYQNNSLGVKIIALPYKGLEVSMYVLLPRAEGAAALKNFSNGLTPEIIEYLISNLKNQTCVLGLPRMKLSSTLGLKRALQSMGLNSLFEPRTADLSLLSSGYGSQPVPRPFPQPIPTMRIPQTIPTTMISPLLPSQVPQALPQVANQVGGKSISNNDYLIFSRVGMDNNQSASNGARNNYFRYEDKQRGVIIEQWGTGFQLRKIRRTLKRRNVVDRRSNDDFPRIHQVAPAEVPQDCKSTSLEENKNHFQDSIGRRANRKRRQTRPMDESFLNFIQSQNFPSYGLDAQRNSANLVNPGLFADEVLHKVEMDVTERGTEAAATTAVILERDGNQKRLVANRPFLFFIRHDPTKLILFSGTVNVPTPNYAVVR